MTEQVPSKATSKDIKKFIDALPIDTKVEAANYVWDTFYDIIDLSTRRYVKNVMNNDVILRALHAKYQTDARDQEKPISKLDGEAEHMKVFQKYIEKLVDKIVSSKYEYSADDSEDLSELFN